MKTCIVGAGAIGGIIGTRIAASGGTVCALARGDTLAALNTNGWRLKQGGQLISAPVSAVSNDAGKLGRQDLVVIAVKAPAMMAIAGAIQPLLGPETVV